MSENKEIDKRIEQSFILTPEQLKNIKNDKGELLPLSVCLDILMNDINDNLPDEYHCADLITIQVSDIDARLIVIPDFHKEYRGHETLIYEEEEGDEDGYGYTINNQFLNAEEWQHMYELYQQTTSNISDHLIIERIMQRNHLKKATATILEIRDKVSKEK